MIISQGISKKRAKLFIYEILCFICLSISYCLVISSEYSYMGFQCIFELYKFIIGLSTMLVFTVIGIFIKDRIIYAIWNTVLLYNLYGTIILYQFNKSSIITVISVTLMLLIILFISKINFNFKQYNFNIENNSKILKKIALISFVLLIPFIILYYDKINLKNLLLIDIYDTRLSFREINMGILGYIISPLTRVLGPILMAYSIHYKNKRYFLFSLFIIVYIFLCGAVKSIFIGIFAVIIFYKGDYIDKPIIFAKIILILTIGGMMIYYINENLFLLDGFVRRVFFTSPYLDNIYYNYFNGNHTLGMHTDIGEFFGLRDKILHGYSSLSMFIGDGIMKESGSNANVGVLTEGYVSFGILGSIFSSIIIAIIYNIIRCTRMDSFLFGVIFTFIYYLNTSFILTLMLTHGLGFFLIFSILFLCRKKYNVS